MAKTDEIGQTCLKLAKSAKIDPKWHKLDETVKIGPKWPRLAKTVEVAPKVQKLAKKGRNCPLLWIFLIFSAWVLWSERPKGSKEEVEARRRGPEGASFNTLHTSHICQYYSSREATDLRKGKTQFKKFHLSYISLLAKIGNNLNWNFCNPCLSLATAMPIPIGIGIFQINANFL